MRSNDEPAQPKKRINFNGKYMVRDNRDSAALVSIFLDSMIHLIRSVRTPLCAKGNPSLPRRWAKHETVRKQEDIIL